MNKRVKVNELELTIISALLAGADPVLNALRAQAVQLTVSGRDLTGCGFFTHFTWPRSVPRVEPENFVLDDLHLEVSGTKNGAAAMLFVRNGLIEFLEVVAITGDWPEKAVLQKISYFKKYVRTAHLQELLPSPTRDLELTRRAWAKS